MTAYTIDATDVTRPIRASDELQYSADEIRAIKVYLRDVMASKTYAENYATAADVANYNAVLAAAIAAATAIIVAAGNMPVPTAGTDDGKQLIASGGSAAWTAIAASASGIKNKIINGGCQIAQRADATLSASLQYGATDRFFGFILSGVSVSGAVTNTSDSPVDTSTGHSAALSGSWSTGYPLIGHRIESVTSESLNSKTVTFTCKLRHDFGAATSFAAELYKPAVKDTFGAARSGTLLKTVSVSCANAAFTTLTFTVALGATDATNGLEIVIVSNTTVAAVSKILRVSDWQLEVGSVATQFDVRPYALELFLCKRYYQAVSSFFLHGYNVAGAGMAVSQPLQPAMRVTPTLVKTGSPTLSNATEGSTHGNPLSPSTFLTYALTVATGTLTISEGTQVLKYSAEL